VRVLTTVFWFLVVIGVWVLVLAIIWFGHHSSPDPYG